MEKAIENKDKRMNLFRRIVDLYVDGFRNMTIGKTLWILILIKLFIIFVVLKVLFFPNFLKSNFNNDADRAQHVRNELMHDK
ncbi:MAG: DUF4492 domain-containing protein [Muribaculaceae bacterium]|jgi:hypothetical protein|nr:DUF4492 domain-containing protein [Muribaculaceae bacterium]